MFRDSLSFPSFATNDLPAARAFYVHVLGLDVTEGNDLLHVHTSGGGRVVVYVRADHQPASFAVLNFPVADIDVAADRLLEAGVRFERFEGMHQDEWGIRRPDSPDDGPPIAWFRDPAGNLLSVMELAR